MPVPAWILRFQRHKGLLGVVGVSGRWETEEFTLSSGDGSDECPKMLIATDIRIVRRPLPIVIRPTKCKLPYISLPLTPSIITGGVPCVVVKYAHRPGRRDHGLCFTQIKPIIIGDENGRCLIGRNISKIEPEIKLGVGMIRCRRRQQGVIAVVNGKLD